jgi:N-acetyl-gamma-glutamylphosphate reductase
MMGFTNISKIVYAGNDKEDEEEEEEVLLDPYTYRDHKHLTEVRSIMKKDKNAFMLYPQFINLIVPDYMYI